MKFEDLLATISNEPIFETGLLLVGNVDPGDVRRQLSRWVKSGRLLQLRRGLYTLAPPYRKTMPNPFLIANRLVRGSYVSLQSALSYHGLIPEGVTTIISVTLGRPGIFETPLGRYEFHHLKSNFFKGFYLTEVEREQQIFLAEPEKALLDLLYLTPHGDDPKYLRELRLQHLELLNVEKLQRLADSPKLRRAVDFLLRLRSEEDEGFEEL